MELRQLHYFCSVAKELHFGRAAERLGMTQPPLSQQIKALEKSLDVKLFHRTNRRVELTEAGKVFHQDIERLLEEIRLSVSNVRHIHKGHKGTLRLGLTTSSAYIDLFSHAVIAFREQHPDAHLSLQESTSEDQIEALLDRRLDIGLLRPVTLPGELTKIELLKEPLMIAMPIGHPAAKGSPDLPVDLMNFSNEGFIAFPQGVGIALQRQISNMCIQTGFVPRIVQEAKSSSTQIALVAAGLGLAIIPALQRRIQISTVAYRKLSQVDAYSSIWMVFRGHQQSALTREFIRLMREELAR